MHVREIALEDSYARFLIKGDAVVCCIIDILLLTRLQFYGHWSDEEPCFVHPIYRFFSYNEKIRLSQQFESSNGRNTFPSIRS